MFSLFDNAFASVTQTFPKVHWMAECCTQTVLSWFGRDRRSRRITTEQQIVHQANQKLALLCQTEYESSTQAEIAWQGYRSLYQQITLPEVRQHLRPPMEYSIIAVGTTWRIVDQTTARTLKAARNLSKVGRRNQRLADALPVRSSR
jgi:hypothetical protein